MGRACVVLLVILASCSGDDDVCIDSEHLDPSLRDASVTHTIAGTRLEWTAADVGFGCVCRDGPC